MTIRDAFISGIKSNKVRQCLLENLTFTCYKGAFNLPQLKFINIIKIECRKLK